MFAVQRGRGVADNGMAHQEANRLKDVVKFFDTHIKNEDVRARVRAVNHDADIADILKPLTFEELNYLIAEAEKVGKNSLKVQIKMCLAIAKLQYGSNLD